MSAKRSEAEGRAISGLLPETRASALAEQRGARKPKNGSPAPLPRKLWRGEIKRESPTYFPANKKGGRMFALAV